MEYFTLSSYKHPIFHDHPAGNKGPSSSFIPQDWQPDWVLSVYSRKGITKDNIRIYEKPRDNCLELGRNYSWSPLWGLFYMLIDLEKDKI